MKAPTTAMADVFSKKKRSEIMSRVRSRGNKATEIKLIKILHARGITGWRRSRKVFGTPDFVFPKARLAVFVDGCFWHGCPEHGVTPKTNKLFWKKKLKRNLDRDRVVRRKLRASGWGVLRIWQHELKHPIRIARRITRSLVG